MQVAVFCKGLVHDDHGTSTFHVLTGIPDEDCGDLARSRRNLNQLCGDLEVDATQAHQLLDAAAARNTLDGIRAMARWYRASVVSTGGP